MLDLGRNHLYNEPLIFVRELHILNFLLLDENLYTEIPDIYNVMLFELRLDKNKLRSINFTNLLPSLRILHLESNSISNIRDMHMVPHLVELYLEDNSIKGWLSLIQDIECLFQISLCKHLRILDLRQNPLVSHAEYLPTTYTLFKGLKRLNETPYRQTFFLKPSFMHSNPVTQIRTLRKVLAYFEGTVFNADSAIEKKREQQGLFELCRSQYKNNKAFMGRYRPPCTKFLSITNEVTADDSAIMEIQEKNVTWLEQATLHNYSELNNFLAHISYTWDTCLLPLMETWEAQIKYLRAAILQSFVRRWLASKLVKKRLERIHQN